MSNNDWFYKDDYSRIRANNATFDYKEAMRTVAKEGISTPKITDLDISKAIAERDTIARHVKNILAGGPGISIAADTRTGILTVTAPESAQAMRKVAELAHQMHMMNQLVIKLMQDNKELTECIKDLQEEVFEQ
jgi:hypothetical protein